MNHHHHFYTCTGRAKVMNHHHHFYTCTGRAKVINPETLVENGAKGGSFALGSMPMREGMKQPAMNAVFPELLKVCLDFSIS